MQKILVIEDNPEMVELLKYNLKRAGFSVATACDGVEGIKKARSVQPDLILLDVMLPELDGIAVCETLRRHSSTASVPIVMLTALANPIDHLSALGAGATAYLTKPIRMEKLLEHLRQLLVPLLQLRPDLPPA